MFTSAMEKHSQLIIVELQNRLSRIREEISKKKEQDTLLRQTWKRNQIWEDEQRMVTSNENFTIKFGEEVRRKKEEIENIYKEEDKKKGRLKRDFEEFMGEHITNVSELSKAAAKQETRKEIGLMSCRKRIKTDVGVVTVKEEAGEPFMLGDLLQKDKKFSTESGEPLEIVLQR